MYVTKPPKPSDTTNSYPSKILGRTSDLFSMTPALALYAYVHQFPIWTNEYFHVTKGALLFGYS